jgi:hypothetical protein
VTVIAGLVHEDKVYLGGDSAGISGWDLTIRDDPKVFTVGPFVMGYTSSFRMGQLLRFRFVPPEHHEDVDTFRFMVCDFIDAIRRTLKDGGYATKTNEQESGGLFLVGYRGRLFRVESDYQVGEPALGYSAVGCGDNLALGALYATRHIANPRERLECALAAAEQHSAGVRGPLVIAVEP